MLDYQGPPPAGADESSFFNAVPYTIVDSTTGEVLASGTNPVMPESTDTRLALPGSIPTGWYFNHRIGVPVMKATRPEGDPAWFEFDWWNNRWKDLRDLDWYKTRQWAAIKAARYLHEYGEFLVPGLGVFDGDPGSRAAIMGSALAASVDLDTYSERWTLADNSVIELNGPQMLLVAKVMREGISWAHERGRELRAAIEAATTVPQIEAVIW